MEKLAPKATSILVSYRDIGLASVSVPASLPATAVYAVTHKLLPATHRSKKALVSPTGPARLSSALFTRRDFLLLLMRSSWGKLRAR